MLRVTLLYAASNLYFVQIYAARNYVKQYHLELS